MSNAQIDERIAQWERMAQEAPDDMAFFSLGNAYRDAERFEDAAGAYAKAIEMNPGMSRAYQQRGACLIRLDRRDEAAEVLRAGYGVAAGRGDVMPQKAMGSLLTEKLGLELPEVEAPDLPQPEELDEANMVLDRRSGQPQPRLDGPPMRGPLGEFIYENFGQPTWTAWIHQGTKVINELRLDFSKEEHQAIYEQHMKEWLQITDEDLQASAKG